MVNKIQSSKHNNELLICDSFQKRSVSIFLTQVRSVKRNSHKIFPQTLYFQHNCSSGCSVFRIA